MSDAEGSSSEPENPLGRPDRRQKMSESDLLHEARLLGLSDEDAAAYAGLTLVELLARADADRSVERLLRQARAHGLGDHLIAMRQVPQWQAHQYALEKFWCDAITAGRPAGEGAMDETNYAAFRAVATRMTPEQVARAAEIMELGRRVDDERRIATTDIPNNTHACMMHPEAGSSAAPCAPSATRTPPAPSATSGTSSDSPGTS